MLQQRQNEAARRQTESALPGEATPKSGYRPSGGEGDKPLQREVSSSCCCCNPVSGVAVVRDLFTLRDCVLDDDP